MPEVTKQGIPFQFPILIKSSSETDGKWIIEGIIATDDLDLQGDIITREALQDAASSIVGKTVLQNHNENAAIGVVLESSLEEAGLWAKILISKTVPDVWTKIQEGILNSFSFKAFVPQGFAIKKWLETIKRFANVVSKVVFVECSLVSCPANPQAKALKWYISKALNENDGLIERENGMQLLTEVTGNLSDIGGIIKGLSELDNIKSDEIAIKALNQINETLAKNAEMISKADVYDDVVKAIQALIGESQSDAQKKDLADASTLIARAKANEYPPVEPAPEPGAVQASANTEEIVSKEMLVGLQKAHERLMATVKSLETKVT